jgi:signal transduction histidine kinase
VSNAPCPRSRFEALLADLAARFADVPAAATLAEVERALIRLIDFFGYDRGSYAELGAQGGGMNIVASAAAAGIAPTPKGEFGAQLSWWLAELHAGRVVALPDLPRSLPPHAVAEAEFCRRTGLRSHLAIPLRARGRVAAMLSFAGVGAAREWPADMILRLTIVGEILAGAMSRARSEEEAQQLRSRLWHADRVARVSALTAAIAHEINQPLTAILSNAQAGLAYLERGSADPEALREILDEVVRDGRRAAETIHTMRGFLRQGDAGRSRIDLAEALQDVLGLLAAEFTRKTIRVETRLQSGCRVTADKAQIQQVVLNLLLNAAHAMADCPPAERRVSLSVERIGEGRVAVEVRDSGVGIPPEHIESVFEPFWTTRKDGLGLGLQICRSIIEAHGGAIRVERNPDRGVSFRFELPAAVEAAAAVPAMEA